MKKTLAIILIVALMAAAASCGGKEEKPGTVPPGQEGNTIELPTAGVSFELPEAFSDITGGVQGSYGFELAQGCGIYAAALTYIAIPADRIAELSSKPTLTQEETEYVYPRLIDMIIIYAIDGGRGMDELNDALPQLGAIYPAECEMGRVGEYRFYYVLDPCREGMGTDYILDEGFMQEYEELLAEFGDMSWIRIYEPESLPSAQTGTVISFETTDLDGNPVKSSDIFGSHTLTMVNIWGTYCGPCIEEMPDLEELSKKLADKNCAIIGVVWDVSDLNDREMTAAKEIISDSGVTYPNLIPWDSLDEDLPSAFIPTTYFIDQSGHVVGEPAVGSRGADDYEALIDEILQSL